MSHAGGLDDVVVEKQQTFRQASVTKGYAPLTVGDQGIAAAYLSQTFGTSRGAVLLLHDINAHIDSAAISILRRQLPTHGWNTLAIKINHFNESADHTSLSKETETTATAAQEVQVEDNPVAETSENISAETAEIENNNEVPVAAETTEPSAGTYTVITTAQRIDVALTKLQQEGHDNIVLIGQGAGGQLALQTLNETAIPIAALIMINTGKLTDGINITDTTVLTLEVLGSRQSNNVKDAALKRQILMKTEQRNDYQLRQIVGENHYFSGVPLQLTNQVHGWLYRQLMDEEVSR